MSTTADLVLALKKELKAAQMTYADLARSLGMAESSVKRMLAKGDMPLSRIDAICRALKLDFAELARRVADAQPLLKELTQEQERAVVADKKLLLCAICVLSQWTLEQVTAPLPAERGRSASSTSSQLDRLGIIELRPLNRYRLKLAKTFRWRPHGPVMNYFRENALLDYFSGGFDGDRRGRAAGARLGQPQPGAVVPRAHAARGAGLRAAAPGRPEAAREGPRGLHAAAGHAQLGIRSVHGAAALSRDARAGCPARSASTRDGTRSSLCWKSGVVARPSLSRSMLWVTRVRLGSRCGRCSSCLNCARNRLRVRIQ